MSGRDMVIVAGLAAVLAVVELVVLKKLNVQR